jgi:CRP-like cAMP-binding protein
LISGIALQLESSIAIGDWIRVDDRPIGKILEIRWRSTLVQTKNGDLILLPNGMLTKGVLTNFNKDGLENRRWVYFNVHLRHPPNRVQSLVCDALRDLHNVSQKTPPDCILYSFEESWARYAVRYRLIDFLPDDPTDSEVRKRIWYTLHRNDIEMSYPGHNVFLTELTEERARGKSERELERRVAALSAVKFLAPLSDDERRTLATGMRQENFGRGENILRAGEQGDSLYLLHAGEVAVSLTIDGLEREMARLKEGDFFGEMSLFTGEARRATVQATGDVECYVIGRALFQKVLENKSSLVLEIGHLLEDRLCALELERKGLSAEAAQAHAKNALLVRIKHFFGLT